MKEQIYNDLLKIVSKETKILKDEPMSNHTSFKIGGNADIFVKAKNIEDIRKILEYSKKNCVELEVVGNGSNLLVKDKGIRGIILKPEIDKLEINNDCSVIVGSGITLSYLSQILLKNEIMGFEFASGIPGTIGGAVKMNAGAHGKEMKDIIVSTKYLSYDGLIKEINNEEHQFEYRKSIFENNKGIILEVKLQLEKGISSEIKKIMQDYSEYRKKAQPLEYASAGSTFKRGNDFMTAKLIDECGLKGYNVGGAEVSEKHAGFVINKGNATAKDVMELINVIKTKVKEKFNKDIELEIKIIGE